MLFHKIKSHAKINLALNIIGKTSSLHKIESIVAFTSLHDEILVKKIKSTKHKILFYGDFSDKIGKNNTVSKLIKILEKRKILKKKKFMIKIKKNIPSRAGLGGGSMNAASILRYFIEKKIINVNKRETLEICELIGSDVVLGLNPKNSILNSRNEIKSFKIYEKFYILIVKPNFGCTTRKIYSKVKKFNKPQFNKLNKKMFKISFLRKTSNHLEKIAFNEYPELKLIEVYLKNALKPLLVRMTGSGSALVAYFTSKKRCKNAKKKFNKKYKNYWCIASKTI